jgi:hypothetical protein
MPPHFPFGRRSDGSSSFRHSPRAWSRSARALSLSLRGPFPTGAHPSPIRRSWSHVRLLTGTPVRFRLPECDRPGRPWRGSCRPGRRHRRSGPRARLLPPHPRSRGVPAPPTGAGTPCRHRSDERTVRREIRGSRLTPCVPGWHGYHRSSGSRRRCRSRMTPRRVIAVRAAARRAHRRIHREAPLRCARHQPARLLRVSCARSPPRRWQRDRTARRTIRELPPAPASRRGHAAHWESADGPETPATVPAGSLPPTDPSASALSRTRTKDSARTPRTWSPSSAPRPGSFQASPSPLSTHWERADRLRRRYAVLRHPPNPNTIRLESTADPPAGTNGRTHCYEPPSDGAVDGHAATAGPEIDRERTARCRGAAARTGRDRSSKSTDRHRSLQRAHTRAAIFIRSHRDMSVPGPVRQALFHGR